MGVRTNLPAGRNAAAHEADGDGADEEQEVGGRTARPLGRSEMDGREEAEERRAL